MPAGSSVTQRTSHDRSFVLRPRDLFFQDADALLKLADGTLRFGRAGFDACKFGIDRCLLRQPPGIVVPASIQGRLSTFQFLLCPAVLYRRKFHGAHILSLLHRASCLRHSFGRRRSRRCASCCQNQDQCCSCSRSEAADSEWCRDSHTISCGLVVGRTRRVAFEASLSNLPCLTDECMPG